MLGQAFEEGPIQEPGERTSKKCPIISSGLLRGDALLLVAGHSDIGRGCRLIEIKGALLGSKGAMEPKAWKEGIRAYSGPKRLSPTPILGVGTLTFERSMALRDMTFQRMD